MIKVGIVGISGYSGFTLLKHLLNHDEIRITYVSANNTTGKVDEIWPQLQGRINLYCDKFNTQTAAEKCDLIYLAVPHKISMEITPQLLKLNVKVIDLSGDYRFKNVKTYNKWYNATHTDAKNAKTAVYGLPELFRENIKKAKLIANPGCYPTAAILGLAPMTSLFGELINTIFIDAKSGVSGAGRKATLGLIYTEVNENFKAYKVLNHQHTPEIDCYLSSSSKNKITVEFVPHLLPINKGILETIYVNLNSKINLNKIYNVYKKFYKTEKFVRVLKPGIQPEIKNVVDTNYCDIGLAINKTKNVLVITSAIDNLVKGASGQAIQNMNIMYGFKETKGLE